VCSSCLVSASQPSVAATIAQVASVCATKGTGGVKSAGSRVWGVGGMEVMTATIVGMGIFCVFLI
jgi:hypothetical protein